MILVLGKSRSFRVPIWAVGELSHLSDLMEGDNGGERGKGCQGTCIKDAWIKLMGLGLRVGGGDERGSRVWWRGEVGTTVLEQQ